jgi:membrane associated rhomboid family serine protease
MVLPLYTDDPLEGETRPYVNWGLIAINFIVFMAMLALPTGLQETSVKFLGFVPAVEMRDQPFGAAFPPELTLISSMFMHANVEHLLGNMLFLWIFGDDIEDALGHLRYLIFYILCGIGGAITFWLNDLHSAIVLIGASGAISGVLTAFVLLRPCAKVEVWTYVWPIGFRAVYAVGIWIMLQVWGVATETQDGVAYWAHIGGALMGALLILVLRPSHLPLFECLWPTKEWDQSHRRTRRWALEHVLVLGFVAVALVLYAGWISR